MSNRQIAKDVGVSLDTVNRKVAERKANSAEIVRAAYGHEPEIHSLQLDSQSITTDTDRTRQVLAGAPAHAAIADAPVAGPAVHAGPGRGGKRNGVSDTPIPKGTSAARIAARLKRDHPDLDRYPVTCYASATR